MSADVKRSWVARYLDWPLDDRHHGREFARVVLITIPPTAALVAFALFLSWTIDTWRPGAAIGWAFAAALGLSALTWYAVRPIKETR